MEVAIIGGGMAGLACATRLAAAGHEVAVFDKGRGPGGRMSTRRVMLDGGAVAFDHGAQYFTARDPRFAAVVDGWARAGLAARWPAAGAEAWVGTPGMNAPVRALAQALDVRWNARVDGLERDNRWGLRGVDAPLYDAVLVAAPAEQAAVLLADSAPELAARAAAVPSLPCWTMLAAFDAPLALDEVIRGDDASALGWAARDSAKPGRAPGERWVVQAGADWSRRHLEEDAPAIAARLLEALLEQAGGRATPSYLAAHRWRYARTTASAPALLWDAQNKVGVCGDWCRGARIEAAWLSGDDLARRMLED